MFFHFQCSSFQGLLSASLEGRISSCIFLRLRFSVLLLLCCMYFVSLCMRSHPVFLHTPDTHTRHSSILSHTRSWTLALPTTAGGRRPIEGLWLEEMNLAPQHWVQTFIHNGSIHTHVWWRGRLGDGRTGGGAPSGRRTAELSYGSSYACFVGFPFVFLWFVASISWFWCIWFSRADTAFLLSL